MQKEDPIFQQIILFSTLLMTLAGIVIISFVFIYQRRKYRHRQEIIKMQESFTQEMLHSKVEIQEQTLQHIAMEIHDNFSPTLSVININLSDVKSQVTEPVKETIMDTKLMVKQLMAEMKALSISLNTEHISHIGFSRALDKYADQLAKSKIFKIDLSKTGESYRLPPNKEIILFRMCQEILNNTVKHANAQTIRIAVNYEPEQLTVSISDDGIGFDPEEVSRTRGEKGSTGLANLDNRALAISGSIQTNSKPGSGAHTTITIPRHPSIEE